MEKTGEEKKTFPQKKITSYSFLLLIIYIIMFCFTLFSNIQQRNDSQSQIGIDYADYYTAGHMALSGDLDSVYDIDAHRTTMDKLLGIKVPFTLPWRYPPVFLLVIAPLALLPFPVSLLLWLAATLLFFAVAVYRMLPQKRWLGALALGFPAVFMNLRWGQNGFLSAALLALGIGALETNPVFAGAMLGCMIYKPQFAVFPFFILLLAKQWKALFSAIGSALTLSLVSLALFGSSQWVAFFQSLFASSSNLLEAESASIAAIQVSVYNTVAILGASPQTSVVAQGVVMIAAICVACWVFRKSDRLPLKGAMLVLGIPLSIPYFMQYDLVILAIPLVLLVYDLLENGSSKFEWFMVALLWLLPLFNWPLVIFTRIQICPIMVIAEMAMIVLRVKRKSKNPALQLPNPAAENTR